MIFDRRDIPDDLQQYFQTAELGLEDTVDEYVSNLVEVFREVKRVLHPSGSLWLNLGDSHAGGGRHVEPVKYPNVEKPKRPRQKRRSGKDLLMVPARVALALQADGWTLRQDIIWSKAVSWCPPCRKCGGPGYSGSVMPESTRDRCVHSHEHVFHFVQHNAYYYDIEGSREPYADVTRGQLRSPYTGKGRKKYAEAGAQNPSDVKRRVLESVANGGGRNLRDSWIIPKQNYPGAHQATFPERLPEIIIKLATSEHGVCEVCLEPWRRRVTRETVPAHVRERFEAARAVTATETGRTDGHTSKRPNYRRKVLREEWEAGCQCGYSLCQTCGYYEETTTTRDGTVSRREKVLQGRENVRDVSDYIQSQRPAESLVQPHMPGVVGEQTSTLHTSADNSEGLHSTVASSPSDSRQNGLCDGASQGNVRSARANAVSNRVSTSQGSQQTEQCSREPSSYDPEGARTNAREAAPCPKCGSNRISQPSNVIPSTVLDPFVGSGRAGIVAKRLGRSFIGIDVNSSYVEMAKKAIKESV